MPISMYKDYRYSYAPSYTPSHRAVTLPVAFQMAVRGEVGAMDVFNQSPEQVQKIINDACQTSFGKDFEQLTHKQQKDVFTMLLLALGNVEERRESRTTNRDSNVEKKRESRITIRGSNSASRIKKWWQFWR